MKNFHKKESPFQGISGLAGGATGLRMAGVATKSYVDDVFSTDLWNGVSDQAHTITNGIDFTEGGLIWHKKRSGSSNLSWHVLTDSLSGANKGIHTNNSNSQGILTSGSSFNNNGFTWGSENNFHPSGTEMSSWSFRKAKGFFDVVTYTGNSTNRTISHNLGCKPGMILFKNLDAGENWRGYHRSLGATQNIEINNSNAAQPSLTAFNNTEPTSTTFSLGTDGATNGNGQSIVAYVFAGGASDAATARSVNFDGSNDGLSASSSDLVVGTGVFTAECWFKYDAGNTDRIISMDKTSNPTNRWIIYHHQGSIRLNINGSDVIFMGSELGFDRDQTQNWYHLALVKSADGYIRMYLNGNASPTVVSDSLDYQSDEIHIGMNPSATENFDGLISNVRLVVGTAVYTSSFKPPTEPLANITNTKILCCNNASVTGKTVGPTITATDSPTASTDSPFDDPDGFKFGEDGDKGIIKTGKYIGNGSSTAVEINLGWEPQWLLIRCSDLGSENWFVLDSIRGIVTGDPESTLSPNTDTVEASIDAIDLTSTGFKTQTADDKFNGDGHEYIYMAIRRPDGYVGKPVEDATKVFAMDTGNSSATGPAFDSNFVVDFALNREYAGTDNWATTTRLTGRKPVYSNSNAAQQSAHVYYYDDFNTGWSISMPSNYQSWMWKRHAGFDVVTYTGDQVARRAMPHSLNAVPEMMWVKNREGTNNWSVYHKGLNDGTNPQNWDIPLNTTAAENGGEVWYYTAPTSTHVTLSADGRVNLNNKDYLMMLFSSVTGISKVGSYDGTGSVGLQITTGFQPRFLIIKKTNGTGPWYVLDTTRGWAAGNDQYLQLDDTAAQVAYEFGAPNATGFQLDITASQVNESGGTYIYYAHA